MQDEIARNDPIKVPLVSKQCLEYMGVPIAKKVEDFRLYLSAKKVINKSKGMGVLDVTI